MPAALPRWTPAFYRRSLGVVLAIAGAVMGALALSTPALHAWQLPFAIGMVYLIGVGLSTWIQGRQEGRIEAQTRTLPCHRSPDEHCYRYPGPIGSEASSEKATHGWPFH